jgi:hypothetical protein
LRQGTFLCGRTAAAADAAAVAALPVLFTHPTFSPCSGVRQSSWSGLAAGLSHPPHLQVAVKIRIRVRVRVTVRVRVRVRIRVRVRVRVRIRVAELDLELDCRVRVRVRVAG